MDQTDRMNPSEQESIENPSNIENQDVFLSAYGESKLGEEDISIENKSEKTESQVFESINEDMAEEIAISQQQSENDESSPSRKVNNPYLEDFLTKLEQLPDSEAKLKEAIDFMEASLAQSGSPHFKSFWEARNICIQLFKENISPALRAQLWTKYSELSKEARRLKEILDEQSAFAVEQIDIAIQALEKDIVEFADSLQKSPRVDFSESQALSDKIPFYQEIQRELNLLNTQASRINALRKELIKTEMRVRQKNKFFQRLSLAGDRVFPRRKELIKELSSRFSLDIDNFISSSFSEENIEDSLFFLREEIKALQSIAKLLTLNTHAFTHTRMRLSECWDKIKVYEKERKKIRAQQKVIFKQNANLIQERINDFNQKFANGEYTVNQGSKELDDISASMRQFELGRDEIRHLREEISISRKPILDKIRNEEQERLNQEQERERLKRKKVTDLKDEAESFIRNLESLDIDSLVSQRDVLFDKINNAGLNKSEKQDLERILKPIRTAIADALSEKKEKDLMSLSEDDRIAIQQLQEVLKQRKERRQEIKQQLEILRKAGGASGLDFEQAMNRTNQINAEKERLEKINQGIQEIEHKIRELESKV